MAWPDLGAAFNNIKNTFATIYNTIRNGFTIAANSMINALNSNPVIQRVKIALRDLGRGIRESWTSFTKWLHGGLDWTWKQVGKGLNWLATVLQKVFIALLKLMDELFRLTEPFLMKIGMWQAKMQYSMGKTILSSW